MKHQAEILALTQKYFNYMVQTRRYLHQHPEVSYKEFETTKFIKNELYITLRYVLLNKSF